MSVTEQLKNIIKDEIERLGYEFVDLNYGKRGRKWFLQVFCDKKGGLTLDHCVEISRELGYELDRHEGLLKHSYNLEVSSPGLNRPLKNEADFKRHSGDIVKVRLYAPVKERREFKGEVSEVKEGEVIFKDSGGEKITVDIDNIANAKLEVEI